MFRCYCSRHTNLTEGGHVLSLMMLALRKLRAPKLHPISRLGGLSNAEIDREC